MERRKKIGFFLGPFLFLAVYFAPLLPQSPKAHRLLAVFFLVVVWWITECIPIPITALLIPAFITILQITPVKEAFAPFSNPIIILFLGSFILARAMSVHSLDRKLAYSILSMKSIAHKKIRILFALGLTKAQKNVLIAFSVTVFLWIFPGIISLVWGREASLFLWLKEHFPESVAPLIGSGLLFLLPVNLRRRQPA